MIKYEHIFGGNPIRYSDLDMVRFDRIVHEGKSVMDQHVAMQSAICNGASWTRADISAFYAGVLATLAKSGKPPRNVWLDNGSGKDILAETYSVDDALCQRVRPCAKWYYFMYLAMFVSGRFVLLETYDNENGGVPEARALFEREMNRLRVETGLYPLVVKTYPLTKDMLYINSHIIGAGPVAMQTLEALEPKGESTVHIVRSLADAVIGYGKT